jgi:uncharacterized protein YdiU (UPF0061 family)
MQNPATLPQTTTGWHLENSYATRLPALFYSRIAPVPVTAPKMVVFNHALAETLGLNPTLLDTEDGAAIFSGNRIPEGSDPIAQAYAGHQFGHFTLLGDGRAVLLGEQLTPDGQRLDIQLKGSGQTPYSRRGDGRAALGPMVREYIISEAMQALGIPTTRSLAVVATGEPVYRETPLPGAVLTRVAASHLRVGTVEFARARGDQAALQQLADYTLERHYPDLLNGDQPYLALLKGVMGRQAALISQWQGVGFIHGVMNTDNMTLTGETIDYGPCAFMDTYHPATVFSSIDSHGRYAYGNQPGMAQWNLTRLAEALLPLLHPDPETAKDLAVDVLQGFPALFQAQWLSVFRAKLGLFTEEAEDHALVQALLTWMQDTQQDFTLTFRALSTPAALALPPFPDLGFADWHTRWVARLGRQPQSAEEAAALMQAHNPAVIPRNHQVEAALEAAVQHGDLAVMHRLLAALAQPFADRPEFAAYQSSPTPGGPRYQTFCGT